MKNAIKLVLMLVLLDLPFLSNLRAQTLVTLHSFGAKHDEGNPFGNLILFGNTLYGTTSSGGSSNLGTVFAINPDGTGYTNLHSFAGTEGSYPEAGLALAGNTLYGTTSAGGSSGVGSVFSVKIDGTDFTNLYSFTGGNDGASPQSSLILADDVLYGTAPMGGISNYGTVFAINTDGSAFTNLYSFTGGDDGGTPYAGLVLAGNVLYGTTYVGGSSRFGTIFAINTNGSLFTNLYSFSIAGGALYPTAPLIVAGNTLYGTTVGDDGLGDNPLGAGTVFAIQTDGTAFTNLYGFSGDSDGSGPFSGLVLSGNTLYGTTIEGGSSDIGVVFGINTDGSGFTNLYSFTGGDDGDSPQSGLIFVHNILYGTTLIDGQAGGGTVFALLLNSPTAEFTANPTNLIVGLSAQFNGPAVDNDSNTITSWNWNFGDGTSDTNQNPAHVYIAAGNFTPTLIVTNNLGLALVASGPTVSVAALPTVEFTATPTNSVVGLSVQFSSPSVDSGSNAITSWNWNFGDGTSDTNQNPTHVYSAPGNFTPTLIVTNNLGLALVASGPTVSVAALPTVEFTAMPTNSVVGLSVQFGSPTVDSGSNAISSWNWNFGDGTSDTNQNPTHVYSAAGNFAPTLLVTNSLGLSVAAVGPPVTISMPVVFTAKRSTETDLTFTGSNGVAGLTYFILMTTNLSSPISEWTPIGTNYWSTNGSFDVTVTNSIDQALIGQFYLIQIQ